MSNDEFGYFGRYRHAAGEIGACADCLDEAQLGGSGTESDDWGPCTTAGPHETDPDTGALVCGHCGHAIAETPAA